MVTTKPVGNSTELTLAYNNFLEGEGGPVTKKQRQAYLAWGHR